MTLYNKDHPKGKHFPSFGGYSAAFTPQMITFLDAVTSGQQIPESGTKALGEVLVAKATYKSIQSKTWEEVSINNLNNYTNK